MRWCDSDREVKKVDEFEAREMETELKGIIELPQVQKRDNGEFIVVDVEEECNDEDNPADITDEEENNDEEDKPAANDEEESSMVELINSVRENLSVYKSRLSSPISLYKVPAKLRKANEEAYTPRSVSIGPIHHGRPELQEMKRYKWRFLDRYLEKVSVSLNISSGEALTHITRSARDMENQVRECYQEYFHKLTNKDFMEMIMLDGIFVIMLLQENVIYGTKSIRNGRIHDRSSASSQLSLNRWVKTDIIHDLMLLENQLPFFVLQKFSNYLGGSTQVELHTKIVEFFQEVGNITTLGTNNEKDAKHLVDFLRNCYLPEQNLARGKIVYNRSATELHEAGVKFRSSPYPNLFEIIFLQGYLGIPTLRIDEHTETLFRNLIAFEQCQYHEPKDITSYIIFMKSLIVTTKDVNLLTACGVIEILHGDHDRVASMFNNLHKETVRHENEFYFAALCTELNEYKKDWWHQWKAKWFRSKKVLRRDYFSNPWSTISVIAAVVLLLLTVVQTICSIISIR